MPWYIQADCKKGGHHICESGGRVRTPPQPTGMMNRKCEKQKTKWSIPGPQYVSEKVYTGQTRLSIDDRVNKSQCHTRMNEQEKSVVVGHCIPLNNNG